MHPESSKLDVATAIVRGLRRGADAKAAPTVTLAKIDFVPDSPTWHCVSGQTGVAS